MKLKHIICALLALALLVPICASAAPDNSVPGVPRELVKDETVFVLLSAAGAVEKVTVSNRIRTDEAGIYTDYGDYSSVESLSVSVKPQLSGDRVTLELPANDDGYTYNGVLRSAALPLSFSFTWSIDGTETVPEALIGRSGHIAVTLRITSDGSALASSLLTQLSLPLDNSVCRNIAVSGGSATVVGSATTVTAMVLPGGSAECRVEFDASAFRCGAMTVSCTPFSPDMLDLSAYGFDVGSVSSTVSSVKLLASSLGGYIDKAAQISEGLSSVASDGSEVKDAYSELYASLSDILNSLRAGGYAVDQTLLDAMTAFGVGLGSYVDSTAHASDSLEALTAQNLLLKNSLAKLTNGLNGLSEQMTALLGGVSGPLTSFAAPGQPVASLQFVMQTRELYPAVSVYTPSEEEQSESFIDRLLDLFR